MVATATSALLPRPPRQAGRRSSTWVAARCCQASSTRTCTRSSPADQLRRCDLSGALTQSEYLDIIDRYAREHPGTEWITGGGWSMEAFPAGVPTAAPLDAVVPDRPVCLRNRDGHGVWVNTRALQLAGIDETTPDPRDGRIERDERGRPVGMLQEGAIGLVSRLIPAATEDDWDAALRAAQAYLVSLGITGWQDAIIGDRPGAGDPMAAYLRAARAGTLKVTVVGALWWQRERGIGSAGGTCRAAQRRHSANAPTDSGPPPSR